MILDFLGSLKAEELAIEADGFNYIVIERRINLLDGTVNSQIRGARIIEFRSNYVDKIRERLAVQDHFFAPTTLLIRQVACKEVSPKATRLEIRDPLSKKLRQSCEVGSSRWVILDGRPIWDEVLLEIDGSLKHTVATARKFVAVMLFGTEGRIFR